MITKAELDAMIDHVRSITGLDLAYSRLYWRSRYPYVLTLDHNAEHKTIARGTKTDLYLALDSLLLGYTIASNKS